MISKQKMLLADVVGMSMNMLVIGMLIILFIHGAYEKKETKKPATYKEMIWKDVSEGLPMKQELGKHFVDEDERIKC